ncbi:sperm axonemal maintenance protein CFAP97D1 [Polypterus senegalus]|uniref:sperm axonemal maintenance protein CFAP97D1 n=1 Tax=Polypterus senegalus TaxID=55291 RepID=UPI0019647C57|nr:sperm axonemal maintenance protein CFAP97D1 [Polypterus senegalus]
MHRAYQPVLPSGNKYLQQKWDKAYYDEHIKKVKSAKPMVNTTTPQTYGHLHLKMKKLKLQEERLSIIERDNNLLLEKMSYIMRTSGRIDNKNEYQSKSLNKEKRQRELLQITKENQQILERISQCWPQYSTEKWQEDWEKNEKYMDSIARYPRGWYEEMHKKNKIRSSVRKANGAEVKTSDEETKQEEKPDDLSREDQNKKSGEINKENDEKEQ